MQNWKYWIIGILNLLMPSVSADSFKCFKNRLKELGIPEVKINISINSKKNGNIEGVKVRYKVTFRSIMPNGRIMIFDEERKMIISSSTVMNASILRALRHSVLSLNEMRNVRVVVCDLQGEQHNGEDFKNYRAFA